MAGTVGFGVALACLAIGLSAAALAADVQARVTDQNGKPAADAVIALLPTAGAPDPLPASLKQATIGQLNETFMPHVSIVGVGGAVTFSNTDNTRHHVYSFSPIKSFQFVLNPGEKSPPVVLSQAGVVALGCNIHDKMSAYVFVTDTPWIGITDAAGAVTIADVPPGGYVARIWHPMLKLGVDAVTQPVTVGTTPGTITASLTLRRERPMTMDHEPY